MESSEIIKYSIAIMATLVTVIGVLWKIISALYSKEAVRSEDTHNELTKLRSEYVETLKEVANIKGNLEGKRQLSEEVLQRIEEISKRDT
jgi:hypothetical protein